MRIALDYTTGIYPGAGIARYTQSLVEALAWLDRENSYALFYAARGLPPAAWRTLARSDFMRVPLPAARTTAASAVPFSIRASKRDRPPKRERPLPDRAAAPIRRSDQAASTRRSSRGGGRPKGKGWLTAGK